MRLQMYAGQEAYHTIKEQGLKPEQIRLMVGASGGPKWLMLSRIDQYLCENFFNRAEQSIELVGSSIGAWRMACYAREDALAAFKQFELSYMDQRYEQPVKTEDIAAKVDAVLWEFFTGANAREIVENPKRHLHVVAVRARKLYNSRHPLAQAVSLALAATGNLLSPKWVELMYPKVMISQAGQHGPYLRKPEQVTMTEHNLREALTATAAVPLAMQPSKLQGGANRWHWDGGIVDYHFAGPFKADNGLVFYPHFSPKLIPGWFDKSLAWRKVKAQNYSNVVVLCPSFEFIDALPYGKIPDRKDFTQMDNDTRNVFWAQVLDQTMHLVEDLDQAMVKDQCRSMVQPLEALA